MNLSDVRTPVHREADNELYDHGCDLVETSAAIRRVAASPDATRAVPALLGCIEAALGELFWAAATLEKTTARSIDESRAARVDARIASKSERMHRGYANLQQSLSDGERAAAAARCLTARALNGAGACRVGKRRG